MFNSIHDIINMDTDNRKQGQGSQNPWLTSICLETEEDLQSCLASSACHLLQVKGCLCGGKRSKTKPCSRGWIFRSICLPVSRYPVCEGKQRPISSSRVQLHAAAEGVSAVRIMTCSLVPRYVSSVLLCVFFFSAFFPSFGRHSVPCTASYIYIFYIICMAVHCANGIRKYSIDLNRSYAQVTTSSSYARLDNRP